jgi:hypothetical protein
MKLFRFLLFFQIVFIFIYTLVVGLTQGWNLLPIFFGEIFKMSWHGQFNSDFLMMLTLSALWTAWRNKFSLRGFGLAFLALFGGISFLAPYLLFLTYKEKGKMHAVLLGQHLK